MTTKSAQKSDADKKSSDSSDKPSCCPRCRAEKIHVVTVSPVKGAWTIYQCDTCIYTWRDTEPEDNTDPDKYPEIFRVDVKDLDHLFVMPSIPALRKNS